MIRPIASWYSEEPRKWSAAQKRYDRHLKICGAKLPTALVAFVGRRTLHDDHFAGALLVDEVPSQRDALVTIHGHRDGVLGATILIVLHFVGLRGRFTLPPLARDIMYYDVEVHGDGTFSASFLVDGRRVWRVRFRDFGCYEYSYYPQPILPAPA